jgi:GAF domain-containing protein
MKSQVSRLSREQAKEILARLDASLNSQQGRGARETIARMLNSTISTYSWVGIYMVDGQNLQLDGWAGPAATEHQRIPIGKGICGFAAKAGRTEIVSDVSKDSRYLQCFLSTKAEIVVPILRGEKVIGEIDIDSDQIDAFSLLDKEFLEAVARKLSEHWSA